MEPLIVENVLNGTWCAAIRAAMDEGTVEAAAILGADVQVEEAVRRAEIVEVAPAIRAQVEARLDEWRERLGKHFGLRLRAREGVGFLRYRVGGQYRLHRDRGNVDGWPAASRRSVSVVLFLNSSRDADGTGGFAGGALTLFPVAGAPVVIVPRAGTLVAFLADTLHEVAPVTEGIRDAVVDWFYGAARGDVRSSS